jgi:hypothetical protein
LASSFGLGAEPLHDSAWRLIGLLAQLIPELILPLEILVNVVVIREVERNGPVNFLES